MTVIYYHDESDSENAPLKEVLQEIEEDNTSDEEGIDEIEEAA